jgi:2-amino-4-hydroxy-6-hydroxymethyldihydropteridine diphosphokinase
MTKVLLGLGSNVNKEQSISKAIKLLADTFVNMRISPTFESKSIGFNGDNFYNLVVSVDTDQTLEEVITTYRRIEDACDRDRSGPKFGPRTLDIDILIYGDVICREPVELPRDEIEINAFVLWPLSLIEPDMVHPVNGQTYKELWQQYVNEQKLWLIEAPWDQ